MARLGVGNGADMVSRSRISPIRITSGAWRRAFFRPFAADAVSLPTSRWFTTERLFLNWYSAGSSMVRMCPPRSCCGGQSPQRGALTHRGAPSGSGRAFHDRSPSTEAGAEVQRRHIHRDVADHGPRSCRAGVMALTRNRRRRRAGNHVELRRFPSFFECARRHESRPAGSWAASAGQRLAVDGGQHVAVDLDRAGECPEITSGCFPSSLVGADASMVRELEVSQWPWSASELGLDLGISIAQQIVDAGLGAGLRVHPS